MPGTPVELISAGIDVIMGFCAVLIIFGATIHLWAYFKKKEQKNE